MRRGVLLSVMCDHVDSIEQDEFMRLTEKRIERWGAEIENLIARRHLLQRLVDAVSDEEHEGVFSEEEKQAVSREALKCEQEIKIKKEAFRERITLYEEKIKKLSGLVAMRKKIIDGVYVDRDIDDANVDLVDHFILRQRLLTEELERSKGQMGGEEGNDFSDSEDSAYLSDGLNR